MKTCITFLLFFWTCFSVAAADGPSSPGETRNSSLNTEISLNMEGTPAVQILKYIETIINMRIEYSDSIQRSLKRPVTLKSERISAAEALRRVCELISARAEITNGRILIQAESPSAGKKDAAAHKETDVIAIVNSESVTWKEIDRQLTLYYPFLEENKLQPALRKKIHTAVLKRAILMKLRNQFIRKSLHHVKITKKEIDAAVAGMQEKIANNPAFKDFAEFLAKFGFKELQDYISKVIIPDCKYKRFLTGLISEDDIKKAYTENKDNIKQVRISHIFLRTGDDKEKNTLTRARAEEIRKNLVNGTEFAEMARKHSEAASASSGGDIGYISGASENINTTIQQTAFSLKKGEISPVITVSAGLHIITVTDIRDSFSELKESIKTSMIIQLQKRHLDQLVRTSDITIIDTQYKQLLKDKK